MKKSLGLLAAVFVLAACGKTSAGDSEELFISSASSLADAMKAAENEFQESNPDVDIVFNFGSSSKLRNQIQQGAPVDLFLSASGRDMAELQKAGFVEEREIQEFARNRLVLASTETLEDTDPESLLRDADQVIAIGEPDSVPLGAYTKEALARSGLWAELEGNLIFAKDARQVLSYIESGNAGLGIVYSSDAGLSESIQTIIDLPQEGIDIVYPAGILSKAENKQAAEAFVKFLASEKGQALLQQYGFDSVEGETR